MTDSLVKHVTVNRQFMRSIRLDADFGRLDAMHGYVMQESGKSALETMANQLDSSQQRAFTWTGPYGGGKSSLALMLASLAGGDEDIRKAAKSAMGIGTRSKLLKFFQTTEPWTIISVVGKRASIQDSIASTFDMQVKGNRGRKPQVNGRRDIVAELCRLAESKNSSSGVLLVIDELGKFLEHAANEEEDIGFYQDLAEAASRCQGKLVILGVLHQAFDQYAARLGKSIQQEWAKVQGRYVDIPLIAATDETLSLLGRALSTDFKHNGSKKIAQQVASVIKSRRKSARADLDDLLDQCWPLHPATAAMLGSASKKRFGQNERSIFSFLSSAEPFGFTDVLKSLPVAQLSYYSPAQFWDYLRANFEPSILASPDSHRWATYSDAIERTEARFSKIHVELVKAVSLIELLKNGSGLAAEKSLLAACVPSETAKDVEIALSELAAASILIFRKHLDAFGVYAGSDFDIESALKSAKGFIGRNDLTQLVNHVDLGPITARRHYWTTGAMRWFSRSIVDIDGLQKHLAEHTISSTQMGDFVLVMPEERYSAEEIKKLIRKSTDLVEHQSILVGVPSNSARIGELITEVSGLEYIRSNSRELHGDNVATAEVNGRLRAVKSMLADSLRDSFQKATWYNNGKEIKHSKKASLSTLASDIADKVFNQSPHIHSEIINRNSISSPAAKALRELMHSMFQNEAISSLGYSKTSADAGLYYTVIKALGIHRLNKGAVRFCAPAETDLAVHLLPAWQAADNLVFQTEKFTRLSDLYAIWQAPPFGIKQGVLPILSLAFFLANTHQLAMYIDDVFTPEVKDINIDEWLQDATRITLRWVRMAKNERQLLQSLSAALSTQLHETIAPEALDSAKALVSLIYKLPHWTRRTDQLSTTAKELRAVLLGASDPHKVVFSDLPLLFKTSDADELSSKIAIVTKELTSVFPARLGLVKTRLLTALDQDDDLAQLRARGANVKGLGSEFLLDAFATRMSEFDGTDENIESLLMLALSKPSSAWTDHDMEAGEIQLLKWAFEFRRLESLADVRGRPAARRAFGVVFGSKKTVSGTFDVAIKDSAAIEKLVKEFMKQVDGGKIKREIFLAALSEAGAQIFESLSKQTENQNG
jgi:Family of unknown function (DUF6079)